MVVVLSLYRQKKSNEVENENLCRQPSTYALWRIIFIWNRCIKFVLSSSSCRHFFFFFWSHCFVHSCITFVVCSVRRLCMLVVHFVSVLPFVVAYAILNHYFKVFFAIRITLHIIFAAIPNIASHLDFSFHQIATDSCEIEYWTIII